MDSLHRADISRGQSSKQLILPTVEQWNERKEEILRLYIDEQWTLKLVMRAMRTSDFDPSESQYRTKLKKWKLRKSRKHRLLPPSSEHTVPSSSIPLATSEPGRGSVSQESPGIHKPLPDLPAWPPQSSQEWQGQFGENECRPQAMNSISEPDRQEPPSTSTQPVNDTLDFTELDVTDENVSATLRCKWKSSIRRASDLPDAGTDLLRVQRAKRLRRSRSPKQTITPTPTEIPSRLQQTPGGLGTSSSPSEFEDFWSSREGLQADCTWPYVGGTGAHDSTLGSLGLDF